MLTISLHRIRIHAPIGLYPEEKIRGNDFEIDVDLWLPDTWPWPYADYSFIHDIVGRVFAQPEDLLETVVYQVFQQLKATFPFSEKIKVAVRKLHPPLQGEVAYAQVAYEAIVP